MQEQERLDLLCTLSHATSLQQLCDLGYEILGNPIFINNMTHDTLAYTNGVEVEDPHWQQAVVENYRDRGIIDASREVNVIHSQSRASQKPVLVTDGDVPVPRLIKALTFEGQEIGVLVVPAYFRPFEKGDGSLTELISYFAVSLLMKERAHSRRGEQTGEDFFISLLDGRKYTRPRAEKRMEEAGFGKYPYVYVLALCFARGEVQQEEALQPMLNDLCRLGHCVPFLYNSTLICVYGSEKEILDWETDAPELSRLLGEWELAAGVSRCVVAVERLREYYHQALETLRVGCKLKRREKYFYFDNLSSFLLFQRIPEEELLLFCHQKVQELADYDREHNTELCATLQVYLEQTKSLVRTAEVLFIHRNTVRYRINKCMELLGTQFNDGNEIFSYILSLRMLEYTTKILKQ